MGLAFPHNLLWLLGIPACVAVLLFVYRRGFRVTRHWFDEADLKRSNAMLKFWLRTTGLLMLFLALVGPFWGSEMETVDTLGREIYIVLDVSASMNAEDLKPSRLEKAKRELKKLMYDLRGDRIGLIVFSKYAYVQCPLTRDYQAASMFLELASSEQFADQGTNFREALGLAYKRLKVSKQQEPNQTQAIILISDGENFGETYESVIERLESLNIKVFCVGIGTEEGGPIPRIVAGRKRGYISTGNNNQRAHSQLLEEDLKLVAKRFRTKYIRIDDQLQTLEPLQEQISRLSASRITSKRERTEKNKYQYVLLLGIMLLATSLFYMPIQATSTQT